MPQKIGPQMLANLDSQLAAGKIDGPTYEARRVEVLELIRKGKAIEHSSGEKTMFAVQGVVLLVLGFVMAGVVGENTYLVTGPVPYLVVLSLFVFGVMRLTKAFKP